MSSDLFSAATSHMSANIHNHTAQRPKRIMCSSALDLSKYGDIVSEPQWLNWIIIAKFSLILPFLILVSLLNNLTAKFKEKLNHHFLQALPSYFLISLNDFCDCTYIKGVSKVLHIHQRFCSPGRDFCVYFFIWGSGEQL